ncbi:glycosyltransferase family 39 protein [Streptomyces sp. ADI96-02]|uniref:glycosyltransferase family 39 protein n=1 Tax=Streptomyces sp. ADI96-02 TaxID=1522760 RepID=UPI001F149D3F|nr:glycosyltransferase family 39 protein [Streptomyces sp. ADI96-02]
MTLDLASRSLPDLWETLGNIDAVHGAYYLMMHGMFSLFGADLLVLRLPSVFATAVAAAGVAALGARLSGPRAGLLAGLAFAVLPDVQKYSQEGRSYALVCALVVWATYVLVATIRRYQGAGWSGHGGAAGMWIGYGLLMLVACLLARVRDAGPGGTCLRPAGGSQASVVLHHTCRWGGPGATCGSGYEAIGAGRLDRRCQQW